MNEIKLPPLESHAHGYPNCECDLEGGDPDCRIQPPYKTALEQREAQLLIAITELDRILTIAAEAKKDIEIIKKDFFTLQELLKDKK